MLEGLFDINWDQLDHAYGKAKDVPWLLSTLTSYDAAVRNFAIHDLSSTIWHQGTVYEATAHTVRFLILILSDPRTKDKASILRLLACCADGHPSLSRSDEWWLEYYKKKGLDFDAEATRAEKFVSQAHEAVRVGIEFYVNLLASRDPEIRISSAEVLENLWQDAARVFPALDRALLQERDSLAKVWLIQIIVDFILKVEDRVSVTETEEIRPAICRNLLSLISTDIPSLVAPRIVRYAALVGYSRLYKTGESTNIGVTAQSQMMQILADSIRKPKGLHLGAPGWRNPKETRSVIETTIAAISRFDFGFRVEALQTALGLVKHPIHAHAIAVALLGNALLKRPLQLDETTSVALENDTVFCNYIREQVPLKGQFRKYPVIISDVDETNLDLKTKKIIQLVLDCEPIWALESNLLEAFGIAKFREVT